ncbi:hypothetical protein Gogos_020095 [Gossypium gossypioides]|uniref:Retrotransposon gag domain-containing protein n=1 Tax=Gossypium gossypioides TaxID=34282 RepID=A0A7J9D561_GOSGO|nr:hypothetical protein [Gossypium gossypioides]
MSIEDDVTKYAENEARAKLRRLTQRGPVREYVREFSELMLQISDLSGKEAFFSFTDGLKTWAKSESSKPNRKGNGGYHEEDEEGHSYYDNGSNRDNDNRKPQNGK